MARIPRSLTVRPNFAVHKIWRGHNREWNLGTDQDKAIYLDFFNRDVEKRNHEVGADLNALTLMSNHAHEVFRVLGQKLFSELMRRHHARYGANFNKRNNRCGKVAQDRPRTTLIEGEKQEMETVFYVHANPVRAKIVGDARDYYWSTHKLYAYGHRDVWMRNVVLPGWYLRLGRNSEQRQREYRRLFADYLKRTGGTVQTFLMTHFFGTEQWCEENKKLVREWRKSKGPP